MKLNPDKPMYENLFSYMDDDNYNPEEVNISENQLAKTYLHECLIFYTRKKLQLSKYQANKLKIRKDYRIIYQSFRLFPKLLQFLQNDMMFTKNKVRSHVLTVLNVIVHLNFTKLCFVVQILKHHIWLFSLHPDQLHITYNLVAEIGKERTTKIVQRYPPIFEHNLEDLKIIVSFLKDYVGVSKATSISSIISIFRTTSDELKRRFDYLSKNKFTQDFLKHPKFINLIVLYHSILPRLRYLEEKNLQYATIWSLTSFTPNYHEEFSLKLYIFCSNSMKLTKLI